ncbi:protein translocase subunit SecD [Photobacterium kishitanii]|uniref:Protein translocase subunit SecD n=1 Tax=Photobacterium kishitanii TaxID=318456 RepID=A0A2T3KMQ0_9GAMM|nr:protein translocase subunit SecD [Photobacterium kishitanii]PSV01069.1 protein translocase subunit SecD [Photobacterium kishitanii]
MRKIRKVLGYLSSMLLVLVPAYLALSVLFPQSVPGLGLEPVQLGIDLKGGGQLVLQVDANAVDEKEKTSVKGYLADKYKLSVIGSSDDAISFKGNVPLASFSREFNKDFPDLTTDVSSDGVVVSGFVSALNYLKGQAISKNIQVLQTRLNSIGVADITMYRQGSDKVVVDLPKGDIMNDAKKILASSAQLNFYALDPKGVPVKFHGKDVSRTKMPFLNGDHIQDAYAGLDNRTGLPTVSIRLDVEGGAKMFSYTKSHVRKPMLTTITDAKYVKGKRIEQERVASLATISEPFGANFVVTGLGNMEVASNLALVLKSGSLQAPMYIVSEKVVEPSVGASNAKQGLLSFVIGMLLLGMYVLYHYRARAVIAMISLVVNASLIVIAMSLLGASLTLTGLAGIVLTMGMAIDSNIIVFERQKEYADSGDKTISIRKAFDSSLEPILDANVTTLLATILLYNCSSVTLKGFALTLGLGVICTVISSFFISKNLTLRFLGDK